MTKWVAAAGLVLAGGVALTVYDLTQRKAQEKNEQVESPDTEQESLEDSPLLQAPPNPQFVVPPPSMDAMAPASTPRRLPAALTGAAPAGQTQTTSASAPALLRREGTILTAVKGAVVRSGNRYEFRLADGTDAFLLLENQLLERIIYLQQHGGPGGASNAWILTGLVTEFHNTNYFLIQQMVIE